MQDNKIAYVEFPGGEMAATKAFYAGAFGWTFQDYGPGYQAFNEGIDGGFQSDAGDGGAAKPLVILFAKDLEAAEARVKAAGGVITVPIFAFPGGRRFHFTDPAGNELGVFTDVGGL